MWVPPNAYMFPSKDEIEDTKRVIIDLEASLWLTLGSSVPSANNVKDLEGELKQRRAWIAPIRPIPNEILSAIFVETCRVDRKAPFTLGAVCKAWRMSILNTSRLWTFVELQRIKNLFIMRKILDRGAPYPLFVDVGRRSGDLVTRALLEGHTERIHGLRMNLFYCVIFEHPLSNLTKLAITGGGNYQSFENPWCVLDGKKLPRLRALHTDTLFDHAIGKPPPPDILSPLDEVTICTRYPHFVAGIILRLTHGLVALHLTLIGPPNPGAVEKPIDILFPRLLHLTIIYQLGRLVGGQVNLWPFHARTPLLLSYKQNRASPGPNIHTDTRSVRDLGFKAAVDFAAFPYLHKVTSNPNGIRALLNTLEAAPESWPDLQIVHCAYERDIETRVNLFNATYGRAIHCELPKVGPLFLSMKFMTWEEYREPYEF